MTTKNNKISIIADENNYIITASWGGMLENGIEVEDFEFTEDIRAYQYVDGKIALDKERLQQLQNEQSAQEEIQELEVFLGDTDFIALQWMEENELGLEHHREDADFEEILRKRQKARMDLRKLKEGE